MSYALRFAPKAREGLAELDVWLQEQTLDEIELLAENPAQLVQRGRLPGFVHDFVRHHAGIKYYVFIHIARNDVARVLRIRSIGHFTMPDSPAARPQQP